MQKITLYKAGDWTFKDNGLRIFEAKAQTMRILSSIIILLGLLLNPIGAHAQKVDKKFTDKLCECSQKVDDKLELAELEKQVENCIDIAVAVNREELKASFVKERKHEHMDSYISYLILETVKSCDEFKAYYIKLDRETEDNQDRSEKPHPVSAECKIAHEGTFRYTADDANPKVFISRKGDVQVEGVDGSDTYVRSKIEWIDECTYTSTFVETNDTELAAMFRKGQYITVVITNVDGQHFSYFTNLSGAKINANMIKVSDEFTDPRK